MPKAIKTTEVAKDANEIFERYRNYFRPFLCVIQWPPLPGFTTMSLLLRDNIAYDK